MQHSWKFLTFVSKRIYNLLNIVHIVIWINFEILDEYLSFLKVFFQTGEIFVNTGLFKLVTNSDQLAAILGHEMAHALLSHAVCTYMYILSSIFFYCTCTSKWVQYLFLTLRIIWCLILWMKISKDFSLLDFSILYNFSDNLIF